MTNLHDELEKDIKKLVGNLKSEEELIAVLKRRLTKKEFKYYKMKIENVSKEEMQKELHCDDERYQEIVKQTIVKINQEKIKKELVIL